MAELRPGSAPRGRAGATPTWAESASNTPVLPQVHPQPSGFRDRIGGRVLVVSGDDAHAYADLINPERSGLIVSGQNAARTVKDLSTNDPDLVLAIDPPETYKAYATEEQPFVNLDTGGQEALFGPPSLEERLAGQISFGATFAVTPTGVLRAGDTDVLKAAIREVNAVDRSDVVFYAPLTLAWFNKDNLRSLIGILSRCAHPVAIGVADRDPDPYSRVLQALRAVVAALPYTIIWRTDLAGIDLIAHGAQAAGIGDTPSKRAVDTPEGKRFALDKRDMHPHVLRRELLRWVRTTYMIEEWYARLEPPSCPCVVCDGRKIERYGDDTEARLEAHRHNVATLMELLDTAPINMVGAHQWWSDTVDDATTAHTALGAAIGGEVTVPTSLAAYAKR